MGIDPPEALGRHNTVYCEHDRYDEESMKDLEHAFRNGEDNVLEGLEAPKDANYPENADGPDHLSRAHASDSAKEADYHAERIKHAPTVGDKGEPPIDKQVE